MVLKNRPLLVNTISAPFYWPNWYGQFFERVNNLISEKLVIGASHKNATIWAN